MGYKCMSNHAEDEEICGNPFGEAGFGMDAGTRHSLT
jgi:hypothetical protein